MLLGRKSQNTVLGLSSTFYWRSQFWFWISSGHAPTISVNCFTISLSDYPTYQRWDRIVFMHFPTLLAKYTSVSTNRWEQSTLSVTLPGFFQVICFLFLPPFTPWSACLIFWFGFQLLSESNFYFSMTQVLGSWVTSSTAASVIYNSLLTLSSLSFLSWKLRSELLGPPGV